MAQRVETGDGWELRLGDCLDPVTGLASLEAVDHVITDPPYDLATTANIVVNPWACVERGAKTQAQRDSEIVSIGTLAPSLGALTNAAVRCGRWAVVFSDAESHHKCRAALEAGGHEYMRFGFWRKPDSMPQITGDRPAVGGEAATISHGSYKPRRWNGGGSHAFWTFGVCKGSERPDHPTPKPLALMEAIVRDFTDPGDLVCDPFSGSGTTGVACIRLGRRFIGWEKDPGYFETAVKRLRATRPQGDLFDRAGFDGKPRTLPGVT